MSVFIYQQQDVDGTLFLLDANQKSFAPHIPQIAQDLKAGQSILAIGDKMSCYLMLDPHKANVQDTVVQSLRQYAAQFGSSIKVDSHLSSDNIQWRSIIIGFVLSDYNIGRFKTGQEKADQKTYFLAGELAENMPVVIEEAKIIATAKKRMMDLVNAPGNKLNSLAWEQYIKQSSEDLHFEIQLTKGIEACEAQKYHALLAVNRGSEWPPLFIKATYKANKAKGKLALVGKGVTFDTGGISIKGSQNMHYMKSDMGGAAAALGAFEAIVALKLAYDVDIYLPITDNCVDANAIKPGDVIDSHSGKTIEVINTDAEGRLILADALSEATSADIGYDVIIDLATLTGSTVRTFAQYAAALFTKNESLQSLIVASGQETNERVWPMPLWNEYQEHLHSDVADISNLGNIPAAGAITAAKFLEFFTNEHQAWAHLDIPASAFGKTPYGKQKSATGYGVELLVKVVEHLTDVE